MLAVWPKVRHIIVRENVARQGAEMDLARLHMTGPGQAGDVVVDEGGPDGAAVGMSSCQKGVFLCARMGKVITRMRDNVR